MCRKRLSTPRCRSELIDSAWVVIVPGQKCIGKNSSVLPNFIFLTDQRIDQLTIGNDDIIALIRNINPDKATCSDGISGQMLLLCDDSVMLPLKIIFRNILFTSIYPDIWKLANVTPIFKKGDKQLIKNYRPVSLLPICGKLFEKIIFIVTLM